MMRPVTLARVVILACVGAPLLAAATFDPVAALPTLVACAFVLAVVLVVYSLGATSSGHPRLLGVGRR